MAGRGQTHTHAAAQSGTEGLLRAVGPELFRVTQSGPSGSPARSEEPLRAAANMDGGAQCHMRFAY